MRSVLDGLAHVQVLALSDLVTHARRVHGRATGTLQYVRYVRVGTVITSFVTRAAKMGFKNLGF